MLSTLILLASLFAWPLLVLFPNMHAGLLRRRLPLGLRNNNPRGSPNGGDPSSSSSGSSSDAAKNSSEPPVYEPSAIDVVVAQMMLQQGLKLPPEVVLSILDFAEYWPHTTAVLNRSLIVSAGRSENRFLLRSRPLGLIRKVHYDQDLYTYTPAPPQALSQEDPEYPLDQFHDWIGSPVKAVEHPCRKIVFTITSRDQGWGGDRPEFRGTYQGSYTWFEAGLERFDKNAERPKDTTEREPALSKEQIEQQQAQAQDQDQVTQAPLDPGESGESGEPSSISEPSAVGTEDNSSPEGDGQEDVPHPYLPVYSLRPIQPTLQPDQNTLHHTLNPNPDWTIQCNKTATRNLTTHQVVWSWDDNVHSKTAEELRAVGRGQGTGTGAFVRDLKLGDVVTVWAKARFGGWANHVEDVRMNIYWAL